MQIVAGAGIVALLVFIGIIACFFRAQANFIRKTNDYRLRVMSAAMISAVIGFLAQGMFDYVFYNYRVLLAFYLFIGISLAFTRVASPDYKNDDTPQRKSKWVVGYHD